MAFEDFKNVKSNIKLAPYTNYKIGGPAEYLLETSDFDELARVINYAKIQNIPIFILAGGSNILISDEGIIGIVIKLTNVNIDISGTKVLAGAGVNVNDLVDALAENSLSGLEFMAGIFGSVGGAIRGNAGAYGGSIADVTTLVKIFDGKEIKDMTKDECKFAYRESIFKQNDNIILEVTLELEAGDKGAIKNKIAEIRKIRSSKLPEIEPNAGCIFKNIPIEEIEDSEKIIKGLDIKEKEYAEATKHGKLPAGYLIASLGYKGKTIGGAQVSPKHGNIIVNLGEATANDVMMLLSFLKQQVRDKLGVQLHEEIQLVGF